MSTTVSRPSKPAAVPLGRRRAVALLILVALVAACAGPDPAAELEVSELETYWAVDRVKNGEVYLAPSVRLRLRNTGREERSYLDVRAAFRRRGENDTWGSGSRFLATAKPLAPGEEIPVILTSDAAYRCPTDDPAAMFTSPGFVDAHVEIWARLPRSNFAKLAEADVDRRVGSRSAEEITR